MSEVPHVAASVVSRVRANPFAPPSLPPSFSPGHSHLRFFFSILFGDGATLFNCVLRVRICMTSPSATCTSPPFPALLKRILFFNLEEHHPGGNPRANLKSTPHRCHPILGVCLPGAYDNILSYTPGRLTVVEFVWKLTKETIYLPLGCLQGGRCNLVLVGPSLVLPCPRCCVPQDKAPPGREDAASFLLGRPWFPHLNRRTPVQVL